jgi:TPR repeat protein
MMQLRLVLPLAGLALFSACQHGKSSDGDAITAGQAARETRAAEGAQLAGGAESSGETAGAGETGPGDAGTGEEASSGKSSGPIPALSRTHYSCPTDDMADCLAYAIIVFDGYEPGQPRREPDRMLALELVNEACGRGFAGACHKLGTWTRTGKKDHAGALAAFMAGCELGGMSSCDSAGWMLARPEVYHLPEAWPQVYQLLETACGGGFCSSCEELHFLYRDGRGRPADPKLAKQYYRMSRDLGCGGDSHE